VLTFRAKISKGKDIEANISVKTKNGEKPWQQQKEKLSQQLVRQLLKRL
jgi:hypothetical protein